MTPVEDFHLVLYSRIFDSVSINFRSLCESPASRDHNETEVLLRMRFEFES